MNPLISIIIPVYNREEYISETLDSILSQEYSKWECIVIDDGSTDKTEEIVNRYVITDSRIHFYNRPRTLKKGAASCRNVGLRRAKGELIQFLDSDDLLGRSKLMEQVKYYKKGKSQILTCKWGWFENKDHLYKRFKFKYHCYQNYDKPVNLLNSFGLNGEFFPLFVYLTPLDVIKKSGAWNEDLTTNDDAEFFTRILLNSSEVRFIPKAEAFYRSSGDDKLSIMNSKEKVQSAIRSWELIEVHIKNNTKTRSAYVRRGKFDLYNFLQTSFPELLKGKTRFFQDRKKYDKRYLGYYLRKFMNALK